MRRPRDQVIENVWSYIAITENFPEDLDIAGLEVEWRINTALP